MMWHRIALGALLAAALAAPPEDPTHGHALVMKEFPSVCWDTSKAQPGLPGAKIFSGPYCDHLKAMIGKHCLEGEKDCREQ